MERDEWNEHWKGDVPQHRHDHGDHRHGPLDSSADWNWQQPDDLLSSQVPAKVGRAVDLGCGSGGNALWLAEHGWRVTAIDFAAAALERLRLAAAERGVEIDSIEADLRHLELDGSFDLITAFYIHLPAPERRRLLDVARGALAPGGTLLFVGHDESDPTFAEGEHFDPALLTTPAQIVADLHGLEIERAHVVLATLHGGAHQARATVVRARRPVK